MIINSCYDVVMGPANSNMIIFTVGKIYRLRTTIYGKNSYQPIFRTKEAAGSFPHTSNFEILGELHRLVTFLVIAVETFTNDEDDDYEFIKVMTNNYIGWLCIAIRDQTSIHYEELTPELAEKELKLTEMYLGATHP